MIDFEKTASDPKRLFRASFQLMEEDKFRRTCFLALRQLDEPVLKAIQGFERASRKPFMLGDRRYRETLVEKRTLRIPFPSFTHTLRTTMQYIVVEEIASRKANKTFFGFWNPDPDTDAAASRAATTTTTVAAVRSPSRPSSSIPPTPTKTQTRSHKQSISRTKRSK